MKRAYKLQEFVAHSSNVNCLKIGKKSSRVLVTGGEDHKVNMWAIGKPNAILSLSGHTSAVESVTFDAAEVVVVAGAASGTIKLWDLEEAKIVRTLTGHRSNCIAVDFHPFGEFFASGSLDTNLKIWDIRRKGCIHTYKGHTRGINSIKFSPDGRWVVSGGEDNVVKLWDLTAGKLMHDFKYHDGQVQCLDFHPHEFLLATGSADRTVKFFDLETFELIGSAGPEATGVRSMVFNPDGRTVLCAMQDSLKVLSWEPLRCHDVVDVGWHKLADLCIHEGKLLGCSYNQSCVGVWVVDLQRVAPYQAGNPGRANNIVAGKFGNNGHQAAQQVSTMPSTKSDNATMDLPQMMEMAMRNVKVTPTKAAESAPPQPRPSTPVSSRGPATVTTTVLSTPTPPAASRRSSLTTARVQTNTSLFRSSPRADSMGGGSPRRPTEPTSAHAVDDTRPASSTGVVSVTTIKSEDRNPEALRGDAGADALRIDPVVHVNRTGPAKGSFDSADRTGLGLMFQRTAKLSDTHGGNKEEDTGVNWNGSRNYRRSSSFDVPMDNSLGRFQSFSDDMSRVQSTRNITGTEASTTGRVEVGRTKALLAQWERKEKPSPAEKLNLEKHNYVVEKPTYVTEKPNYVVEKPNFVVEKPSQERPQYLEKSSYQEVSSGTTTSGVRTLGLDINSFVPKGSNFASDRLALAQKHDIEIIEELMHQHHTMASIMQSRLTNMQVVRRFWSKNDVRGAVEAMKKMTDQSVLVDVLTVLMERSEVLTLEICCMLIPLLNGLLSSENDRFLMTALQLLGKLVETFGPVIHATRASSPSLGVDLHAEQRLERCNMCYHELQTVGHCLLPLMRRGGNLTKAAKELRGALEQV